MLYIYIYVRIFNVIKKIRSLKKKLESTQPCIVNRVVLELHSVACVQFGLVLGLLVWFSVPAP